MLKVPSIADRKSVGTGSVLVIQNRQIKTMYILDTVFQLGVLVRVTNVILESYITVQSETHFKIDYRLVIQQ